jgi:hypothetical protein
MKILEKSQCQHANPQPGTQQGGQQAEDPGGLSKFFPLLPPHSQVYGPRQLDGSPLRSLGVYPGHHVPACPQPQRVPLVHVPGTYSSVTLPQITFTVPLFVSCLQFVPITPATLHTSGKPPPGPSPQYIPSSSQHSVTLQRPISNNNLPGAASAHPTSVATNISSTRRQLVYALSMIIGDAPTATADTLPTRYTTAESRCDPLFSKQPDIQNRAFLRDAA